MLSVDPAQFQSLAPGQAILIKVHPGAMGYFWASEWESLESPTR